MKVLVVGATGLLGSSLVPFLKQNRDLQVLSQSRSTNGDIQMDPTLKESAQSVLNKVQPNWILNLAALTDVDLCQADPQKAYEANVRINENLGSYAEKNPGTWILSISTDHIYDSLKPSREDQIVIRNMYAMSKLAGEMALPKANGISLRTNFFGKSQGSKKSFSDWIINQWKTAQKTSLFKDCFFSPLHMKTLCRCIQETMQGPHAGIYNLGSQSFMSKADFALKIADVLNLKAQNYEIVSMDSIPQRTPRPQGMAVDSAHWMKTFGQSLPTLEEEINLLKEEI